MENYDTRSVPEGAEIEDKKPLTWDDIQLKALEIAAQEVRSACASGVPKSVDSSDLLSVALLTIGVFFHRYAGAEDDDLALLRLVIRGDLRHAVRKERKDARGVEIPPGANQPCVIPETPDWARLTDEGVITRKQGEVLVLSAAGYSQVQIATFLGITQPRVTERLNNALRNLSRKYFSGQGISSH